MLSFFVGSVEELTQPQSSSAPVSTQPPSSPVNTQPAGPSPSPNVSQLSSTRHEALTGPIVFGVISGVFALALLLFFCWRRNSGGSALALDVAESQSNRRLSTVSESGARPRRSSHVPMAQPSTSRSSGAMTQMAGPEHASSSTHDAEDLRATVEGLRAEIKSLKQARRSKYTQNLPTR